jgi:TonB family protein
VKRSFAVSSIAHIAFLTLVIVPGYHKVYHHGPEVINVKLLAEERPAPKPEAKVVPPKQEEVAPEKEPDKPKMSYKAPPEKKQTTKKPEPPKPKQTQETTPKSTPARSSSGSSESGPTSSVRVDDKDFRFGYYLEIVKERVSGNWSPPPVTGPSEGVITTVYFKIQRDGRVSDVKVEKTSDFDLFDRSALRAVDLSSPLPPLPAGFKGKWLGVHFEFEHKSHKGL